MFVYGFDLGDFQGLWVFCKGCVSIIQNIRFFFFKCINNVYYKIYIYKLLVVVIVKFIVSFYRVLDISKDIKFKKRKEIIIIGSRGIEIRLDFQCSIDIGYFVGQE